MLTKKEQLKKVFRTVLKDMLRRIVKVTTKPAIISMDKRGAASAIQEIQKIVDETVNILIKEVSIRTPLR